jgi:hypothetical protein
LPNKKSVKDLNITVQVADLKQKTGDIVIDKQLGSCYRLNLLVQMLGGAITADGTGEKMAIGKLEFDQSFELEINVDLKEHIVCVKHRGVFKLNEKRWIILQNI